MPICGPVRTGAAANAGLVLEATSTTGRMGLDDVVRTLVFGPSSDAGVAFSAAQVATGGVSGAAQLLGAQGIGTAIRSPVGC